MQFELSGKGKRRQAEKVQGYDPNPPACSNCTYFLNGAKGNEHGPAHPPLCNLGNFYVAHRGTCNKWQGRRGETLE